MHWLIVLAILDVGRSVSPQQKAFVQSIETYRKYHNMRAYAKAVQGYTQFTMPTKRVVVTTEYVFYPGTGWVQFRQSETTEIVRDKYYPPFNVATNYVEPKLKPKTVEPLPDPNDYSEPIRGLLIKLHETEKGR